VSAILPKTAALYIWENVIHGIFSDGVADGCVQALQKFRGDFVVTAHEVLNQTLSVAQLLPPIG
jgi:hypothetical protein